MKGSFELSFFVSASFGENDYLFKNKIYEVYILFSFISFRIVGCTGASIRLYFFHEQFDER